MAEASKLRQSRPELSLRRFARYAGMSYWQLRDFEQSTPARNKRGEERDALREQVEQVALLHPTYGYRFLYQELRAKGEQVGLHRVRELLGELELNPPQPRKTRKPASEVVAPPDWPAGRRVQIDATRLSLSDGVCWVYHVLDVQSRVVLASKAVRSLSMHLAKSHLTKASPSCAQSASLVPSWFKAMAVRTLPVRSSKTPACATARGSDVRSPKKVAWAS